MLCNASYLSSASLGDRLDGQSEYSHITQVEMKNIMKQAVDTVYKLLWLKQNDPEKYEEQLEFGNRYTRFWDEPKADVG